ncbi:MAG: type III pantothenate kinase [Pseudidiomarina maritima]|uniref:Type III pantothenate kinase n=1 Tax=Pseudidiomarina fusca TaxID=2965078 RepID=A0ABU3KXR9_9GAMM|nr:type III pantothenate kinase [Pseudidiomarina sp. GXY010]MDT7526299.1 type III pantothenate kinase [Pseudidiomarina sp. GXY010]MDX1526571.1 type III pantothenate kinase [Pseudidiomarina maritima]
MEFKLLVDAGNTRVKTALMDAEGHLEPLFNVSYSDLPKQQIEHSLKGIWLAEVSGTERAQQVEAWLSQFAAPITTIQSEQAAFGVENAYETPQHLGVDRWLALIGAYNEVPKATLIIDAGTAITVDWLNAEGKHLGGWIVPGVDLMKQAVTARAPKVFSDADTDWGKAQQVGRSTPECLANGCVNAFVGVIRQALAVSETELDWFDFRVLFSGGSTPLLPADLKRRGELRTELVLQGLSYYAKTN